MVQAPYPKTQKSAFDRRPIGYCSTDITPRFAAPEAYEVVVVILFSSQPHGLARFVCWTEIIRRLSFDITRPEPNVERQRPSS
jgi:hypothetical protein